MYIRFRLSIWQVSERIQQKEYRFFIVYFRNIYLIASIILISKRVLFIGEFRSFRLEFYMLCVRCSFNVCACSINGLTTSAFSAPPSPSVFLAPNLFSSLSLAPLPSYIAPFQYSTHTYIVLSYLYNPLHITNLKKMSKNQIPQIKYS